ncbi:cellulose-binding domain-containing protein [Solwaraspora sp. WMMD1047]|uniref:cellulose-binding domain-containing protein n=1 Tax=Solwaraspora sp. WMMD1047 TaxID=3016102 RepID=UPI002417464B|nr:cellulose-binding domain-containing protein [Solwaraspora sp. WMMD1047]MDG4833580.1 cellulose-binding domain-containing protein [Solwaraspora sp. WMMD1047]
MFTRRHRLAVFASATAAIMAGGVLTATVAQAATACRVDYAVTSQWQGGFGASVTINNLADPVNGWTLTWTFSAGQTVTQMWNASHSQSGGQVSATNVGYNGSIATGGSVSFGFNGSSNGTTNPVPTSFAMNGVTCNGGTAPTTAPPPNPTTPPPNPTTPPPNPTTPPPTTGCGSGAFNAEVTVSGGTWTARNGGSTVYTGGGMLEAMQAAVNSLSAGRSSKQRVVVRGSGSMSAGSRLSLPSYTTLAVCGTINVTGSGSGDYAPVYSRGATDVEVQNLTLTGSPLYGIFARNVNNLTLGQIDMRLSSGLGVRIDNHGGDRAVKVRNVRIDNVYVSGTGAHGVETYGVDGLTIGTVTARNTGYSGLLLNDTINATVGTVDAQNAGAGTGYAAFRMANRNGRVGSGYPTNIRVGNVIASGGGRGIFCVSESGGAVIDRVTITNTGNNAILIENCYNVTIAGISGTVTGGGEVRIASRTEFPISSGIRFQNLTVTNTNIRQNPCGGANNTISNVNRVNSTLYWC